MYNALTVKEIHTKFSFKSLHSKEYGGGRHEYWNHILVLIFICLLMWTILTWQAACFSFLTWLTWVQLKNSMQYRINPNGILLKSMLDLPSWSCRHQHHLYTKFGLPFSCNVTIDFIDNVVNSPGSESMPWSIACWRNKAFRRRSFLTSGKYLYTSSVILPKSFARWVLVASSMSNVFFSTTFSNAFVITTLSCDSPKWLMDDRRWLGVWASWGSTFWSVFNPR